MHIPIGKIAEHAPTVTAETPNKMVDQLFSKFPSRQGIVVVEGDLPIALITRTNFYQKLGSLYGYNLYIGRPARLIMDKKYIAVDYFASIFEVSKLAMERPEESLYDYIVVTKDNKYNGVVSIRMLLLTLAKAQSKIASDLNPLTGLPGNQAIQEKLQYALRQELYTILYIDLDNFKSYNDVYGFVKGDQLIRETAALIKRNIHNKEHFIGHIGGDDFLAILYHQEYQTVCQHIIDEFNHLIETYYSIKHLSQGFVLAETRAGIRDKIPLVSISIAVASNRNYTYKTVDELVTSVTRRKDHCKRLPYSCYID